MRTELELAQNVVFDLSEKMAAALEKGDMERWERLCEKYADAVVYKNSLITEAN